jgi:hypothetical protein
MTLWAFGSSSFRMAGLSSLVLCSNVKANTNATSGYPVETADILRPNEASPRLVVLTKQQTVKL